MVKRLVDLTMAPGLYTEAGTRGAKNRWRDGNHVRFRKGLPEKLGGWTLVHTTALAGCGRTAFAWRSVTLDPTVRYIAFASDEKVELFDGDSLYDITPNRDTGQLTDPFSTTNLSAIVVVADTTHGVTEGSYVFFENATAVGGITIDGEYRVTAINDANEYTITHSSAATSTAGPGGGTVDYEYRINIGSCDAQQKLGFGVGPFGEEGFGDARGTSILLTNVRTWSVDKWGEDLIASPRGGAVYTWDTSAGTTLRATLIANAPATNEFVVVSPEDRHLICFGAHDGSVSDPLNIRWSDQEDFTDFTPTDTNTAGDKRLDNGNGILSAIRSRGEIVIFTDLSVHTMFFTGPPFTFGFRQAGEACGIIGPRAMVEHMGTVYYMGCEDFYMYDGEITTLKCDVRNHVFDSVNAQQQEKVIAGVNLAFSEIWWFYPSDEPNLENNKYVTYNFEDGSWAFGEINRTAWIDRNVLYDKPVGVDENGFIYTHEVGVNDQALALDWFLESNDLETGEEDYLHFSKLIPDFIELEGMIDISLLTRRYPHSTQVTKGPYDLSPTTEKMSVRARGRQVRLRMEANEINNHFRADQWQAVLNVHGKK